MHCLVFFTILAGTSLVAGGCGLKILGNGEPTRLENTQNIQPDSMFQFTISPNDRWVVFFKRLNEGETGNSADYLGNLRVLDLTGGTARTFVLDKGKAPEPIYAGDASWAPDSSHCLLPPPAPEWNSVDVGILIDTHDAANVRITSVEVQSGKSRAVKVPGEKYTVPERYTCSDCFRHTNDVALMKKHVDAKYLRLGTMPVNLNQFAAQIVSPDGTKIYYQKGPKERGEWDETTLYEFDIPSGKERQLISYRDDCPVIDRLRPSPDGKHLAYQLTIGLTFMSDPIVYVLDLQTGNSRQIARANGGTMHWTSTSDKLFFYKADYLYVAEFEKPKPPAATRPTDKPAKNPGP